MKCQICGTEIEKTRNRKYCPECQRVKNAENTKKRYLEKKKDPKFMAQRKAQQRKYSEKYLATTFSLTVEGVQELVDLGYSVKSIAQRYNIAIRSVFYFIWQHKIKKSFEYAHGGLPVNCKYYKYF